MEFATAADPTEPIGLGSAEHLGQGPRPDPAPVVIKQKRSGCGAFSLGAILVGILLVGGCTALLAVSGVFEENEPTLADGSGSSGDVQDPGGGSAAEGSGVFAVGDLVSLGDWQVQVHGAGTLQPTDDFFTPSPGMRWYQVDVEATNRSDRPEIVSSLLCFSLLDGANREYSQTIVPTAVQPPDGEVGPGSSRRGVIVYDVPVDAAGFRLEFKCDLFSTGTAQVSLPDA